MPIDTTSLHVFRRYHCHTCFRAPGDRVDVFVSHVWHDAAFVEALHLQDKDRQTRSCHGSVLQTEEHRGGLTPETVFYHLKAPGLM